MKNHEAVAEDLAELGKGPVQVLANGDLRMGIATATKIRDLAQLGDTELAARFMGLTGYHSDALDRLMKGVLEQ